MNGRAIMVSFSDRNYFSVVAPKKKDYVNKSHMSVFV